MIQFDQPSGGIGKKDRKRYTFSDFRGVDKSVAEINVAPNHAVESTNFVDRNGVLHKRYGWEQVYQFDDEINGFWELHLDGAKYTICYAGKNFYLKTASGWEKVYESDQLVSRRSSCYTQKNKAYFIGCGDFLVFRYDSKENKYAFFRVYDDKETYIPTTTAQISPIGNALEGVGKQYVRDNVNLLTGWRKNTIVGTETPIVEETQKLIYLLDAKPVVKNKTSILTIGDKSYTLTEKDTSEVTIEQGITLNELTFTTKTLQDGSSWGDIIEYYDWMNIFAQPLDSSIEEGQYGDWVLRLEGEGNVSCGLRWKREPDDVLEPKENVKPFYKYRVYTLYAFNEDRSNIVPILRDFHRLPYDEYFNINESDIELDYKIIDANKLEIKAIRTNKTDESEHSSVTFQVKIVAKGANGESIRQERIGIDRDEWSHTYSFTIGQLGLNELESATVKFVAGSGFMTRYNDIYRDTQSTVEMEYKINLPPLQEIQNIPVNGFFQGGSVKVAEYKTSTEEGFNTVAEGIGRLIELYGCSLAYTDDDIEVELFSNGQLVVCNSPIIGEEQIVTITYYSSQAISILPIQQSLVSTLYGVGEEANRLFIANGDNRDKPNVIYFSEMDDFTYFPDNFTKAVGGSANEVKGFIRLANGEMAALKSLNGNEPTVFVFRGEYISGYYDAEETESYTLPKFSTSGVSITQGVVAPHASANLADDSLFLSQNGVYALELSQGTDSQRFAKERSLPINNLLKECNLSELEEACAITYENKYYLAVPHYKKTSDKEVDEGKTYYERKGKSYVVSESPNADIGMSNYYEREDCVYVADAHYTFKPMGAMADTFSYEWYPLTNIPVHVWFILDGELYFGTKDGRVCRFIPDQYYDVKKLYLASDPESEKAKAYSQKQVKTIATKIDTDGDGLPDTDLDTNADGHIDTFSIAEGTEIEDGDTIIFTSGTLKGVVYDEVKDLLNKEMYIVKYQEKGVFNGNIQLKYTLDDDAPVIEFTIAKDLVAAIQKKTVVAASRTMPTFDFGMPDYLKTLESFTVTMNGVDGGYALLDISTRNNNRSIHQSVKGQSVYNDLKGFSNFSFNVPFQNSFTKKVLIRNFNYAILKINNDMPVDCAVSSISLMYKYNRASGGIK